MSDEPTDKEGLYGGLAVLMGMTAAVSWFVILVVACILGAIDALDNTVGIKFSFIVSLAPAALSVWFGSIAFGERKRKGSGDGT